jgi:nucleoside-diphosphate-sugar epimerase
MAGAAQSLNSGPTVLVTGATGFVGGHVCDLLHESGYRVRILTRRTVRHPYAEVVSFAGLHDETAMARAAHDTQAVVHLAARVHVMRDPSPDPLAEFRAVNVQATKRLAEIAANAGVETFLFASSVKAVGEMTTVPWNEEVVPSPQDPYGLSKLEAEQTVQNVASASLMRAVVFRFPVVYGAGVKANILRLCHLVRRGTPLPLGGIRNQRSLIYVGNVAAAIAGSLQHRDMRGLYFASDGEDVSTPGLAERIGKALGKPAIILPAPIKLLRLMGTVGDRLPGFPITSAAVARLCGSLAVDSTKLVTALGGPLPFSMDAGLQRTADWYRGNRTWNR